MNTIDDLNISTLTALTSIDNNIDIEKLYSYIQKNNLSRPETKENNFTDIGVIRHPIKLTKASNKTKIFKNQIQLHLPLQGKTTIRQVKIKVFNNGRLHITGTQSMKMIDQVLNVVNDFFIKSEILILNQINISDIMKKVNIVMVNMTIDAEFKINQKLFKDILINKYNIYSEFNPKTYAGLNVHYEQDGIKQASFLIFQSGKINIAGAKGIDYLISAKKFILDTLSKERNNIELK